MFTLVGVDGNAFSVMGYTARALRQAGLGGLVKEMQTEAMAGDYNHLLVTCMDYLDKANEAMGYDGEEDEES